MIDFILNTTADQWKILFLAVCAVYGGGRLGWDFCNLVCWVLKQLASMGPR